MKSFRKSAKNSNGCTNFSMNEIDNHTGVQITIGAGWVQISNTYSFTAASSSEYQEISEEEFNEAFEQALSMLTANLLIAA